MKSSSSRASERHNQRHDSAFPDESSTRTSFFLPLLAFAGLCALPPLLWKIATYRRDLATRNRFFPACPPLLESDRLLILAPHPDDETLATGSLIAQARQRNLPVRVVFLTNGDGSGSTRLGEMARSKQRPTYDEIAALRQREALAALWELGVSSDDVTFLGYPDGGTMKLWRSHWRTETPFRSSFTGARQVPYANALSPGAPYAGQSVVRDLVQLLEEFQPTRVVTTDGNDSHPDHRAAFCFLLAALEQRSATSSTRSTTQKSEIDFWTVLIHHAIWPVPHGFRPDDVLTPPASLLKIGADWRALALDVSTRKAKRAALEKHESQMTWTPHYLRGFLRRNEVFNLLNSAANSSPRATILRDSTRNSPTQSAFPALDLQSVQISRGENDVLHLQIEARAISRRATYGLLLHFFGETTEQSCCYQITARFENNCWRAQLDDATQLSATETTNGLTIALPRTNLPHETRTVLVSANARWNNRTFDETSTFFLRLNG